jgi:two-component system nitrogen regulation response regulator GlnG
LLLVEHFLAAANSDYNKRVRGISPEAMLLLRSYSWPGNIRELQSVIRQAVLDTSGPILFPDALPLVVKKADDAARNGVQSMPLATFTHWVQARLADGSERIYDEAVETIERTVIGEVLRSTGGNQGEAAKRLGITRTTLRTKLRKLGLAIERVVNDKV